MADSIKLTILKKLTTLLLSVTPANGYESDLTGRVFRGRTLYGKEAPETMITIVESPRPDGPNFAGENVAMHEDWQLLVQGWAKDDPRNPTDPLYPIMADVEAALFRTVAMNKVGDGMYPADYRFGNLCAGLQIGPGVVRPASEVSSKAFFYLPLRVSLARQVG